MNKKVALSILAAIIVIGGVTVIAMRHSNNDMGGMSMSSTTPSSSQSSAVASKSVAIKSFAFSATTVKVKVGDTVTWTNQDNVHHTVTADSGTDGPKSGDLGQGQTYKFTFQKAGTYTYHCEIHPSMHGTVIVS